MADPRELRTLRDRQEEVRRALDRIAYASPGSAPMLVQVFNNGAIPTAVDKYFACHPVEPGGAECEGCTPTFTAETGTVFVLVIGPRVPVAGDYLMAEPIGGRWVAENPAGGCSADALHVCICNCLTPVPRQFFYGDANGTHTLNRVGSSLIWTANLTQASVNVYDGSCVNSITALNYGATLAYSCPTGTGLPTSGAYPTGNWSFNIGFRGIGCAGVLQYTNNPAGLTIPLNAGQIVTGFTCNISGGLSFTIPTTATFGALTPLPTPGGGGSITVVP